MTTLKNDLLLRALRKEKVERPPVWMMRQAGRYLPDYIKLRNKYDFFTRVQTPELATAITLQPVDQVGVDAAIIFSDILVIPQALGLEVLMEEGKGPSLPTVITEQKDVDALDANNTADKLQSAVLFASNASTSFCSVITDGSDGPFPSSIKTSRPNA